jgi:hypothetical protein
MDRGKFVTGSVAAARPALVRENVSSTTLPATDQAPGAISESLIEEGRISLGCRHCIVPSRRRME